MSAIGSHDIAQMAHQIENTIAIMLKYTDWPTKHDMQM